MERVDTDPQVEGVLARGLGHVLVGANTGGLEGLARELLVLVGDEVDAVRELVNGRTLAAQIEDTDLTQHRLLRSGSCSSIRHKRRYAPSILGHHGCTATSGTACSCSNGSSGRDGDPFLEDLSQTEPCERHPSDPVRIHRFQTQFQPRNARNDGIGLKRGSMTLTGVDLREGS